MKCNKISHLVKEYTLSKLWRWEIATWVWKQLQLMMAIYDPACSFDAYKIMSLWHTKAWIVTVRFEMGEIFNHADFIEGQ